MWARFFDVVRRMAGAGDPAARARIAGEALEAVQVMGREEALASARAEVAAAEAELARLRAQERERMEADAARWRGQVGDAVARLVVDGKVPERVGLRVAAALMSLAPASAGLLGAEGARVGPAAMGIVEALSGLPRSAALMAQARTAGGVQAPALQRRSSDGSAGA